MTNEVQHGEIRLYCCGGAGINIGSHFENGSQNEPGFANIKLTYVDTSKSNLAREGLSKDSVYLLEGVDGSGKVRTENHAEISRNVRNVLQQFKPSFFNVVLFSGSGGSGSVFGPLIVSELLQQGQAVTVIMIGSDDSAISANNTIKTIKSLDAIADRSGLPVVCYYRQNYPETKRSEIDADCHYVISTLAVLCSKQNAELDTQDVVNWVQYTKPTSAPARFAKLTLHDTKGVDAIQSPISIASIMPDPDEPSYNNVPDYHCVGYPAAKNLNLDARHLVISFDGVAAIAKALEKKVEELDVQKKARVTHEKLAKVTEVGDDGLVL